MSLDINWEKLDAPIAESLKAWLNGHFRNIDRPSFIGTIEVRQFDFGSVPPDVIIRDLTDPLAEFYLPDFDDSVSGPYTPPDRPGNKVQLPIYRDDLGRADSTALLDDSVSVVSGPVLGTPPSPTLLRKSPSSTLGVGWGAGLGINAGKPGSSTPSVRGGSSSASAHSTTSSGDARDLLRTERDHNEDPHRDRHRDRGDDAASAGHASGAGTPTSERTPPRISNPQPTRPAAAASGTDEPPFSSRSLLQSAADSMKGPWDSQLELDLQYSGNMRLEIATELIIHHPTPGFMTLPILMTLTGFSLSAFALVAYLGDRICFCFKTPAPKDRFLEDVSIESEVGDKGRQAVLKNVGKIEKFVVEALRRLLYTELVYPNFLELELVTAE